jgi:hypothetical protein
VSRRFFDLVARGNDAVGEDVCTQAAAMDEVFDHSRPRRLLEVKTRLARPDAITLNDADPEVLADEIV